MFDGNVDAWIVSKAMPVGEALVGDLFNAVALFVKGPLTVGLLAATTWTSSSGRWS